MAERDFEGVFFIQRAPKIEFRDGLFHVCYDIGKRAIFEVVMQPKTFAAARLASAAELAKWQYDTLDKGNVRQIR